VKNSITMLTLGLASLWMGLTACVAQGSGDFPDAPSVVAEANPDPLFFTSISQRPFTSKKMGEASKGERITHRLLVVGFPAALTADMFTTGMIMTHPLHFSFHQGMCTTITNGGPPVTAPCPPEIQALEFHETVPVAAFEEGGWAKFVGPRNAPGVIALNVLLDGVVWEVGTRLWHRNECGRKAMLAVIGYKTIGHAVLAFSNVALLHRLERDFVPKSAIDVHWY